MTDAGQEGRERVLTEAFVSLADTLVTDYDVIDLLHRLCSDSVALLPIDAAGLMLSDQRGTLRVVSSSTEQAHLVELFQLQANEGPCLDCFRTSQQVISADLGHEPAGRASSNMPGRRVTAPCTRCPCACARRPSAGSTCSEAHPARCQPTRCA
jgi:hypothetical protein